MAGHTLVTNKVVRFCVVRSCIVQLIKCIHGVQIGNIYVD